MEKHTITYERTSNSEDTATLETRCHTHPEESLRN